MLDLLLHDKQHEYEETLYGIANVRNVEDLCPTSIGADKI